MHSRYIFTPGHLKSINNKNQDIAESLVLKVDMSDVFKLNYWKKFEMLLNEIHNM